MIKYEFKDNDGKNWVRISKSEARKLFDKGERSVFVLVKCAHSDGSAAVL